MKESSKTDDKAKTEKSRGDENNAMNEEANRTVFLFIGMMMDVQESKKEGCQNENGAYDKNYF